MHLRGSVGNKREIGKMRNKKIEGEKNRYF